MSERIFKINEMVPARGITSMDVIFRSEIHEIHLWRVTPGEWIYPHIHPNNEDMWYIIHGEGEYYINSNETRIVEPGNIAVAKPEEVHGMYNSGSEDIIIYSVLSPRPVEIEEAPGFDYPE